MSVDYYIYSTKTGECISDERYAGMPFFWKEARNIGQGCFIDWVNNVFLGKIKKWTTINSLDYWPLPYAEEFIFYYSKSDIYKLRDMMDTNKDVLVELMENNDSDGLIVVMI